MTCSGGDCEDDLIKPSAATSKVKKYPNGLAHLAALVMLPLSSHPPASGFHDLHNPCIASCKMPAPVAVSALDLFRRQYFQLLDLQELTWPPRDVLRSITAQQWLYNRLFNTNEITYMPPKRYQFRVLKKLLQLIEASVEDPEEDVGSTSTLLFSSFCYRNYMSQCPQLRFKLATAIGT
jgi:hypothetical protein